MMQDKLQRINKMIAALQKETKLNANQKMLLDMYMKKKEELEKYKRNRTQSN